jgi:hypothetical protein
MVPLLSSGQDALVTLPFHVTSRHPSPARASLHRNSRGSRSRRRRGHGYIPFSAALALRDMEAIISDYEYESGLDDEDEQQQNIGLFTPSSSPMTGGTVIQLIGPSICECYCSLGCLIVCTNKYPYRFWRRFHSHCAV